MSQIFPKISASDSSLSAALSAASLLLNGLTSNTLDALKDVKLPARFQRIRLEGKDLILDCAHNPAAAAKLAHNLERAGIAAVDVILGMMKDKDVRGFVEALAAKVNRWILVAPATERAMSMAELRKILHELSDAPVLEIGPMESLKMEVLDSSISTLVTGSFYTVGEFIQFQVGDHIA